MNALERMAAGLEAAASGSLLSVWGSVTELTASHVRVAGLSRFTRLGDWVAIETEAGEQIGEAIRVDSESISVRTFEDRVRASIGARARITAALELRPHELWKGRVIDALARPADGGPPLTQGTCPMALDRPPPPAFHRERLNTPVMTGTRAIDVFTPLCAGQRIGVFAGSGVGKSTLLSMLAKGNKFDTAIFAAIGERGREVKEFVEDALAGGMGKAIVVVSTSDESPMMRRLAAKTALATAEYFRDLGERVLLIFDFDHPLRSGGPRNLARGGRAARVQGLSSKRLHRSAEAPGARGLRRPWRIDHRRVFGPRRRRRP